MSASTGPQYLRDVAMGLRRMGFPISAPSLEQLAAQWDAERDLLYSLLAVIHRDGGHYTGEHGIEKSARDAQQVVHANRAALERAANDLMLSEESFVTMRAKRDEVLSELWTTRAALVQARAVERQLRIASDDPRASYETSRAYERAANDLEAALGVAPVSAQTCQECGHLESEHRSVAGGLGFACRHAGCDCIKQPAPAGGEARP